MKKVLLMVMALCLTTSLLNAKDETYYAQETVKKIQFAQVTFRKKLQRKCGYTVGHWAQQHTLIEWKVIHSTGKFKDEFTKMCPRGADLLQEKWIEPLYLFAKEYAQGTGNHPRC